MVMNEAFRISLGPLQVDHPLHFNHQKELGYQKTIEQLLKPVKVLGRLHFFRYSDARDNKD